jgi:hypothetical protein
MRTENWQRGFHARRRLAVGRMPERAVTRETRRREERVARLQTGDVALVDKSARGVNPAS